MRQSRWFLLNGNSHVFKRDVNTKPLLIAEWWSKSNQVCQKAKSNIFAKALPYQPSVPAEFPKLCTHKTKKHRTVLEIYSSCSPAALLRKKKLRNDFKRPGKSKPSFIDLTNDLTIAQIFFISRFCKNSLQLDLMLSCLLGREMGTWSNARYLAKEEGPWDDGEISIWNKKGKVFFQTIEWQHMTLKKYKTMSKVTVHSHKANKAVESCSKFQCLLKIIIKPC